MFFYAIVCMFLLQCWYLHSQASPITSDPQKPISSSAIAPYPIADAKPFAANAVKPTPTPQHFPQQGPPQQEQQQQAMGSPVQVPSIHFGDIGVEDACDEQGTIFRLSELLRLQISIVGSLEMACLALRHTDVGLANLTHQTFRQARDLFQHGADVVTQYARVAQQVSRSVLPDLHLAIEEEQPDLAMSLLEMVKSWVADMKRDGEIMQLRYKELQDSVLHLLRRAQLTKTDADQRLTEAVQAFDIEAAAPEVVNLPMSLNSFTRQLFDQLGELSAGTGGMRQGGEDHIMIGAPDTADEEAWKRKMIDLLFMAPGVAPSFLPGLEPVNFSTEGRGGHAAGDPSVEVRIAGEKRVVAEEVLQGIGPSARNATFSAGAAPPRAAAGSSAGQQQQQEGGDTAVVRYVPTRSTAHTAAESATRSSTSLLRALRELRRVNVILQGCSNFWANMYSTVQKLTHMKELIERLVGFATSSSRLRERFEQRLQEYTDFWSSLERLCKQYISDHRAASSRMQSFVQQVSDAVDLVDTAESVRTGVLAGRRERQRQHEDSYAVVEVARRERQRQHDDSYAVVEV